MTAKRVRGMNAPAKRRYTVDPDFISPCDDSGLMHGRDWRDEDLAGWLLSEKLNGCRGYWDGRMLRSRAGYVIDIPAALRAELPQLALDGEIYAGPGRFYAAQAAATYGRFEPGVRFMVFDADVPGEYLQRQAILHAALGGTRKAVPIAYRLCHATADAFTWLRQIRAAGGEGVIARHPANVYAAGRTAQILKLTCSSTDPADPGSGAAYA
jgi:DNA ligase-1